MLGFHNAQDVKRRLTMPFQIESARKSLAMAAVSALLLYASPIAAQRWSDGGTSGVSTRPTHRNIGRCDDPGRDDRRRHDERFDCSSFGDSAAYADGEWALYNNRSWNSDSYNDWWHDRPDRAFPRWVLEQRARGTCTADRMWWSGSGWHC